MSEGTGTGPDGILVLLEQADTASVADVMGAMGLECMVLAPDIRPLGKAVMAGRAICASGSPDPSKPALATFELDRRVIPGSVIVISTGGSEHGAIIGANMVASMARSGAVGFLLDAGVRDCAELASRPQPVWCRYRSPASAHKYWRYNSFDQPVELPGLQGKVTVFPGDFILADEDGVCVIPQGLAPQILTDAIIHAGMEGDIARAIAAGVTREAVTRRLPRLAHVRPLTAQAQAPEE